jgi:hypothetical protein
VTDPHVDAGDSVAVLAGVFTTGPELEEQPPPISREDFGRIRLLGVTGAGTL